MNSSELTPMQKYLLDVWVMLGTGECSDEEMLKLLMQRPKTLQSAIKAAFYKSVGFAIERYV